MEYLALGCRVIVGLVFAASAVSKVHNQDAFAEFVRSTRIMLAAVLRNDGDHRVAKQIARAVVAGEIAVPVAMVVPFTVLIGLVVATGLLTAFSIAIAATLRSPTRPGCRCFGAKASPLGTSHLVRAVVLLGVVIVGIASWVAFSDAYPNHPVGIALAIGTALVCAALTVRLDDIVSLYAPSTNNRVRRR